MNSPADEPKTVTPVNARRAAPVVKEPDQLALEEAKNSHAQNMAAAEQGWIGRFLGSKSEKPGNVAFFVIVFCFVFICTLLWKLDITTSSDKFLDLASPVMGIIGLALGYLFGSSDRK